MIDVLRNGPSDFCKNMTFKISRRVVEAEAGRERHFLTSFAQRTMSLLDLCKLLEHKS